MTLARALNWLAIISLLFATSARVQAVPPSNAAGVARAKEWMQKTFGAPPKKATPGAPRRVTIAEARKLIGSNERVIVTGTMTFESAPGIIYIHDDTGKMRAYLASLIVMKSGDRVEVTGIPVNFHPVPNRRAAGETGFPSLARASAVNLGPGTFPTPIPMRGSEPYASEEQRVKFELEFVTVHGMVIGHSERTVKYIVAGGEVEVRRIFVDVDDDGHLIKVEFKPDSEAKTPFPIGTHAEFTGTCTLENRIDNGRGDPISVSVPSVAFAKVIALPPFWTRPGVQRNAKIGTVAAFAITALVMAWLVAKWRLARRTNIQLEARVAERTSELQIALAAERELGDLKGNFVSMVSHEFRTPLGVIGSSAQILDRYFARLSEEDRREHLDNVISGVHRMARMMEDVLVLSRVDSGRMDFRPDSLALGDLCRRIADEMRSLHGGTVALSIAPDAESCPHADENLLRHILTNLLINAHKYSPLGAPVQLTVTREKSDAVFIVRDEGIGIPQSDHARLFEAFHRGSNVGQVAGTGLGLIIVRRCAEIHGGTVSVVSSEGAGSTFTVRLPVWIEQTSS